MDSILCSISDYSYYFCDLCKKDPHYELMTPSSIFTKYNISKNQLKNTIDLECCTDPPDKMRKIYYYRRDLGIPDSAQRFTLRRHWVPMPP